MRHYCTYFDRNYLVRGLTLYRSLQRHGGPSTLWVLCLDEQTEAILRRLDLPGVRAVSLAALEDEDPALPRVRPERSRVEYFFTSSPSWCRYVLDRVGPGELVSYVDADLFFFADPEPIFSELGDDAVLIVGHRFPEATREEEERFGIYNVGLITFRNDDRARRVLEWWRERCLEWCHDRLEDGRFGDQKYLDVWPDRFEGVHVLRHKGAGLAPWNWMRYDLRFDDEGATVDGERLIFFHFHDLKILGPRVFDPCLVGHRAMPRHTSVRLYGPYIRALRSTWKWLREREVDVDIGRVNPRLHGYRPGRVPRGVLRGRIRVAVGRFVG